MSAFSLYIPSVYANITAPMISETFHRINIGRVKHVELVQQASKNGPRQNKAYVFFDALYQSDLALNIHDCISKNVTTKLSYGRSEHVFWVLLNSKRQYDGSSNNGEYVEPDFTEEEIEFMEQELERQEREEKAHDISNVNAEYANTLEQEIFKLRNLNTQIHSGYIAMFNSYQNLNDKMEKWKELGLNNQGDRLCNTIKRENEPGEIEEKPVAVAVN